ncbi:hypothetical protein N656DRAFT_374090 [Canariomyces notabilis]|uniref:Uncharacterized protein n=1 Tax=Canariomyces notabilis TaxID=2074819 RepID=A0AAN6QEJ8_9PEZI|nr:hypothetical protein N656DRAFT_374090 [Canariomyces arenarius]
METAMTILQEYLHHMICTVHLIIQSQHWFHELNYPAVAHMPQSSTSVMVLPLMAEQLRSATSQLELPQYQPSMCNYLTVERHGWAPTEAVPACTPQQPEFHSHLDARQKPCAPRRLPHSRFEGSEVPGLLLGQLCGDLWHRILSSLGRPYQPSPTFPRPAVFLGPCSIVTSSLCRGGRRSLFSFGINNQIDAAISVISRPGNSSSRLSTRNF